MKEKIIKKSQNGFYIILSVSLLALTGFLVKAEMLFNPMILIGISLFLLYPYRKESPLVRRLMFLISSLFTFWIIANLGLAILPFLLAFVMAYLLEPLIYKFEKKNVPRWVSALLVVIVFISIVSGIAIFLFPMIFHQLEDAIVRISGIVRTYSSYLWSDSFYSFLNSLGVSEEAIDNFINTKLIPELESLLRSVLEAMLAILTGLSGVARQLVNAILVPILFFYFMKDYRRIRIFVKSLLRGRHQKVILDMQRISNILRKYLGWQLIAAMLVATVCSVFFSIFGVPYPIVLGLLCGMLNPIPYIGIMASMVIAIAVVLLLQPENMWQSVLVIVIVVNMIHFINTYFLEPNIAGKQVGLHPLMLIASLFVFGGLFGIVGLLFAVPTTAVLMMFLNDWLKGQLLKNLPAVSREED